MWTAILNDVIGKTLAGFGARLEAFAPNLLAMLVILCFGSVLAWGVKVGVGFVLPRVGFDRFAERSGVRVILEKGGISAPASRFVALALAWSVFAVFMLLGIGALNLQIAMDLVSQAFTYLPQILIAIAVFVLGSLAAAFVRRSVLIAAVNAGVPFSRLVAGCVHTALIVLFAAMALEHLGVGRQILLAAFVILFGGVVLALALAFGLAGRIPARRALDQLLRSEGRDDLRHL